MDKATFVKWAKFISFALVLIGGINWLFIGLFDVDIIGAVFGGAESTASRVLFTLFGTGAVILLTIVLVRAFREEPVTTKKVAA